MKIKYVLLYLILLSSFSAIAQKLRSDTTANANLNSKTRIFKVSPVSFIFGYTTLAFEKKLKSNRSLEYQLSLIGAGLTSTGDGEIPVNQYGASFTVGYKFLQNKSAKVSKKFDHSMGGLYFRTDLTITAYNALQFSKTYQSDNLAFQTNEEYYTMSALALIPVIGFQKVTRKRFTWDLFVGLGLGIIMPSNKQTSGAKVRYGITIADKSYDNEKLNYAPALKAGLLVGGLF